MNERFKRVNCFLQPFTALGVLVILVLANFPVYILLSDDILADADSFVIKVSVFTVVLLLAIMVFLNGIFGTVFAVKSCKADSVAGFELNNKYIYILDCLNSFLLLFAGVFTFVALRIITYYAIFSGVIISPFRDYKGILVYYLILFFGAAISLLLGYRTKKLNKEI